MANAQAGALAGARQDAPDRPVSHRRVNTTALLGITALIALALVAGAQWGDSTTPDLTEIEGPAAQVSDTADRTVFDGRGKWGGYAR